MAIKTDRSSLPTTRDDEGWPPDEDDSFGVELVRRGLAVIRPDDDLELAVPEAGPLRASWAGFCARQISYMLDPNVPKAPLALADRWRFAIGTFAHQVLQAGKPDGSVEEVAVDLRPIGMRGSAHADLVDGPDGQLVVTNELKSINGFGFKTHATKDRGPAQGPRISAVLQGGLAGLGLEAAGHPIEAVRIVYVAVENISKTLTARLAYNPDSEGAPFLVQWTIPLESIRARVEREARRLEKILVLHEKGEWAPRAVVDEDVPASAVINDPTTGGWVQTTTDGQVVGAGKTWQCNYCDFQATCAAYAGEGR